MSHKWTDERIDKLRELWGDGLTGTQIARELGGVTRNAVIGKANRLGLSEPRPSGRKPKPPPTVSTSENIEEVQPEAAEDSLSDRVTIDAPPQPSVGLHDGAPRAGTVSLLDLENSMCRWPFGTPGIEGFGFCGRKKAAGSSYCAEHKQVGTQPLVHRRSRQKQAEKDARSASK